jgi:glutamine synthetase
VYVAWNTSKTRHNEVAPNQFEFAPIFEETNLAVDHNCLLMDVMQKWQSVTI